MARSPVLFVLILLITFPVWICLGGLFLGLIGGLIGVVFGLIGAGFGIFFGIIGGMFHFVFGLGHSHHFFNKYTFLALIIIVALVMNQRSKRVN